jgi:hypothetical protein
VIATPWTTNAWGRPHIASLGDWTGDGVPDAVWDDSLGTARLLSFEGGELMPRNLPIARTSRVIGAGDVEQDSRAEIVTNVNLAQLEILAPAAPSPTATTQPHHLRITARRRCRVERRQFKVLCTPPR